MESQKERGVGTVGQDAEEKPRKTRGERYIRTLKDGQTTLVDGVEITIKRKRRHGGQYRVEVNILKNFVDDPPAAA